MEPAVQIADYETDLRIYKKNKNKCSSISFEKKSYWLWRERGQASDDEDDEDDDEDDDSIDMKSWFCEVVNNETNCFDEAE